MNFSSFYLYNRLYTFPSSSSLKLKCHVNLIHKNTLPLCYVFTNIFYFFAMYSQKYFTSTLCVHKNILFPHCVHKNILLLHYVFTKLFYFYMYTMCSQKIFYFHTVFTTISNFHTMCSQQYFTSTLCGLIKYKYDIQNKMNCELMLIYDTPLFGKQEVGI